MSEDYEGILGLYSNGFTLASKEEKLIMVIDRLLEELVGETVKIHIERNKQGTLTSFKLKGCEQ